MRSELPKPTIVVVLSDDGSGLWVDVFGVGLAFDTAFDF
jgi:hypothetical protein